MRLAPRSVWQRLSEEIRRPIRNEVLILEQEVLHDYVRAHSAGCDRASAKDYAALEFFFFPVVP
jgi:hypothetical protein